MYKQRHMELGGKNVISHFTFTPPLIAASNLEGQGCFIFPINTEGKVYRQDGRTEVKSDQGVLMKCGAYVNKWENLDDTKSAEVIILRLYPEVIAANLQGSNFGLSYMGKDNLRAFYESRHHETKNKNMASVRIMYATREKDREDGNVLSLPVRHSMAW